MSIYENFKMSSYTSGISNLMGSNEIDITCIGRSIFKIIGFKISRVSRKFYHTNLPFIFRCVRVTLRQREAYSRKLAGPYTSLTICIDIRKYCLSDLSLKTIAEFATKNITQIAWRLIIPYEIGKLEVASKVWNISLLCINIIFLLNIDEENISRENGTKLYCNSNLMMKKQEYARRNLTRHSITYRRKWVTIFKAYDPLRTHKQNRFID